MAQQSQTTSGQETPKPSLSQTAAMPQRTPQQAQTQTVQSTQTQGQQTTQGQMPAATGPPGTQQGIQPEDQKKPIWKKWWFWLIIVAVILILVAGAWFIFS